MRIDSARRSRTHRIKSPAACVITIDGPAGVGKSTVAKLLAKRLRLLYVDTGATYRALAYELLTRRLDPRREAHVARMARALNVRLRQSATNGFAVLLNRRDVSRIIRTEAVTEIAAIIAQHPRVRAELVRVQRRLAHGMRMVVEGRDTGTVVFPRAPYKFFLTAKAAVRAKRRRAELSAIQGHAPSLSTLQRQLARRDRLDRRRAVGPLRTPVGAITLDTSTLTAEEVVARILAHLSLESFEGGARHTGSCPRKNSRCASTENRLS